MKDVKDATLEELKLVLLDCEEEGLHYPLVLAREIIRRLEQKEEKCCSTS